MARRRTRKRSSRPSASSPASRVGTVLLWFLVLALGGFAAWLWDRGAAGERSAVDGLVIERSEPLWTIPEAPAFDAAESPEPTAAASLPTNPVVSRFDFPPARVGNGAGSSGSPTNPALAVPLGLPGTGGVSAAGAAQPGAGIDAPLEPGTVGGRDSRLMLGTERLVGVQLALARRGISSGSIDGVMGAQTRAGLRAFQRAEGLPATGEPDPATLARLDPGTTTGGFLTTLTLTTEDLARLATVPRTWLGKSSRTRLDYETPLEMVAERSHAHPRLIRALNPGIDWLNVKPGTVVRVPETPQPTLRGRAEFIRISLSDKMLRAYDARSNLLVQFPCSIARKVEKRPMGVLRVAGLAPNPNYRFDPDIFPESEEARRVGRKLMIPPGPNNPVGTAWIGLDRPGYGIHGTPHPEEVGRTESHGCFRLSNWNAEHLLKLAWIGLPVHVVP